MLLESYRAEIEKALEIDEGFHTMGKKQAMEP
jgi:hypothetical protein